MVLSLRPHAVQMNACIAVSQEKNTDHSGDCTAADPRKHPKTRRPRNRAETWDDGSARHSFRTPEPLQVSQGVTAPARQGSTPRERKGERALCVAGAFRVVFRVERCRFRYVSRRNASSCEPLGLSPGAP